MGLKSGSRDPEFEGSEEADDTDDETPRDEPAGTEADEPNSTAGTETTPSSETGRTESDSRPTMESLPYKLRRSKVNEGREQVPYFLRPEVTDGEDELQSALETMLGETVYKSDYREAAMVVAQRNPELVAAVLREWGYDLD